MTAGGAEPDGHFPPHVLRQYAFLADGTRGALIGPRGDVAWLCAPRWDSDGVFSALIGGPGNYAVRPEDPWFVWGGYYEDGTLIWRSRWISSSGIIECREALAFPGDADRAVLLRRIVARDTPVRMLVGLNACAGFGAHRMADHHRDEHGVWQTRSGDLLLRWSGAPEAREDDTGGLNTRITLEPGQQHDLVLEISAKGLPETPVDPGYAWEATEQAWHRVVPDCADTVAPRDARTAYAVLRGLTSPGGGMVAAATTSLPERAEGGRNYDYRYVWLRDQSYAAQAVATHGGHELLDDAVGFASARLLEDGPRLAPAYTITGESVPDERQLSLRGYPGGSDKIGNWVNHHFQLDTFGEVLQLFAAAARHERLGDDARNAVNVAVDVIADRYRDGEAGLWELHNDHWTHSRLACVAGLRACARDIPGADTAGWTQLADRLLSETADAALHPSGRWQRTPTDSDVDAALVLPPVRGALPAEDPRTRATLDAVRNGLTDDGFVYRFRHDQRPLHEAEGAFLLCGFMMAMATHHQGNEAEALLWFERNRTACGPPGLFTEEFDVVQRQLRGNLPQAFVHAMMLECAATLDRGRIR